LHVPNVDADDSGADGGRGKVAVLLGTCVKYPLGGFDILVNFIYKIFFLFVS
jgi:hypothetical protein